MIELKPGSSHVVGTREMARRYGKSDEWARTLFIEWERMQNEGAEPRVFRKGKQRALYTTLAVLHRHMPPGRDEALVRKVAELERDMTTLARRLDRETTARTALEQRIEKLLRQPGLTSRRTG